MGQVNRKTIMRVVRRALSPRPAPLLVLSVLGHAPAWRTPAVLPPAERLVAEAPIWGDINGIVGYAYLPVALHGRAVTLIIDLNADQLQGLRLYTAPLTQVGITLSDTTTLDSMTVGSDVQRHVPIIVRERPKTFVIQTPPQLPPVVGMVGVHFLTTRYDLVYDFPHQRVQLYAFPTHPVASHDAWLPPGFTPADCGRLILIPPGAATFTGVQLQLDGHPVTGVLEMMPYGSETNRDEKMNAAAFKVLGLSEESSRLQDGRVTDIHLTVGRHTVWTGPVKVFTHLQVEDGLPPQTPVMLMNLTTIQDLVLFNSTSGSLVCLRSP